MTMNTASPETFSLARRTRISNIRTVWSQDVQDSQNASSFLESFPPRSASFSTQDASIDGAIWDGQDLVIDANESGQEDNGRAFLRSEQVDHCKERSSKIALALDKIDSIFEIVADAMLSEKSEVIVSLPVLERSASGNDYWDSPSTEELPRSKTISFPGKTEEEAWRFSE